MAAPERDTYYTSDGTGRTIRRESNATAWFVGIIVALALLAIGYLVFSANSGPSTTNIQNAPAATAPMTTPDTSAPATTLPDNSTTPMTTAPANETAPATNDNGTAAPADNGSTSTDTTTPATTAPAPANQAAPAAQ